MARHRIVLSGGGTGGHIYPALAVAEQLKDDPDVESILYVGVHGKPEEKLAGERGLQFVGLRVSGLPRELSPRLIRWPFDLASSVVEARKVLELFRPTVVLGTGGYATAPPLIAALMLGVPAAIHEPDAHPGMVNRLLAGRVQLVSVGMSAAAERLKASAGKIIVNGNPVRRSFINLLGRDAACAVLGLDPALKTLLITGGSQGAQAINEAVLQALPAILEFEPPVQVIHQVGDKNLQAIKERLDRDVLANPRYCLRAYFEDLALAYAAVDLAVCRAGAMTIAELAVTGTPAVFIPFPHAAADHQTHNARWVAAADAAVVLPQNRLSSQTLRDQVLELLGNDEQLRSMRRKMHALGKPQAAADLASQIRELSTAYQARARRQVAESG